jgi:Helix-turn-helix domain
MKESDGQELLRSEKKRWHFSVEKDFIVHTGLSPMARMLYMVLESYVSPNSPVPFPGMFTLARIMCCTRDTVLKYRNELEDKGWLKVESNRRKEYKRFERNAYVLLDPFGAVTTLSTRKKAVTIKTVTDKLGTKSTPREAKSLPSRNKTVRSPSRSDGGTNGTPTKTIRASRGVRGGVVAPACALAGAKPPAPPQDFDERSKELFIRWNECYRAVFQREAKHTQDDLHAIEHLAGEEKDARTVMALILMAWSMKRLTNVQFNPHFYCNKYSGRPSDLWRTLHGHDQNNLDHIRVELGWMARKSEVDSAYEWLDQFVRSRSLKENGFGQNTAVQTSDRSSRCLIMKWKTHSGSTAHCSSYNAGPVPT